MSASAPPYSHYSNSPHGFPVEPIAPPQMYPPLYGQNSQLNASAPPLPEYEHQPLQASGQPQVVFVSAPALGSHKARMNCSNCRNEIQTTTDKKPSIVAWICSVLMCGFGLIFGCCLIPLCVDSCKDTHHSCPNCGTHLGTHHAF